METVKATCPNCEVESTYPALPYKKCPNCSYVLTDRDLIERAVNFHDRLVEQLKTAMDQLDEWGRGENRENVEANNAETYQQCATLLKELER